MYISQRRVILYNYLCKEIIENFHSKDISSKIIIWTLKNPFVNYCNENIKIFKLKIHIIKLKVLLIYKIREMNHEVIRYILQFACL